MITEYELRKAIADCQAEKNPNANTCVKLAAFYTIQDHIGKPDISAAYSAAPETSEVIAYRSDTDFSRAIRGKDADSVLAVVDDLMNALQVLSPRMYRNAMRHFEEA